MLGRKKDIGELPPNLIHLFELIYDCYVYLDPIDNSRKKMEWSNSENILTVNDQCKLLRLLPCCSLSQL